MSRSFTILYADDDLDDLFLIREAFENHTTHLRVVPASNGKEAVETLHRMAAEDRLPCLVILDINMPVLNGKEALRLIKNQPRFRKLPVMMFTTSSNPSDKKEVEALGADFITKPSTYTDMASVVKVFVDRCTVAELSA